jgi:nitroreductase
LTSRLALNAVTEIVTDKQAVTSVPVHPTIAHRWSPRALDPTVRISAERLRALLEAARWAPSFGNTQPARYLVGRRGEPAFDKIFGVLNPGNQEWAGDAAALLLAVALTTNEKGALPYAEYGVGLASENLVLQAVAEGLVAHQMAGFRRDAARAAFDLPANVEPLVVIAVGALGDPARLSERNHDRELAPRHRVPLAEFAFAEEWGKPAF